MTPPSTDVQVYVPRGFRSEAGPQFTEFALPPSALAVDDWADLIEADLYSDRVGQLLFDVFAKVTADGWADGSLLRQPKADFEVADLLDCLRGDSEIQSYYSSETIRALAQRLRAVGALSFFGNPYTPLRTLLEAGRLSIVLLNRLPDTLRSVLVSVLMRRILADRSEASEYEKQLKFNPTLSVEQKQHILSRIEQLVPPTVVALDEAQNVLPSERATKATQTIIKYVREGRNHGLSFIFTTQQPSAIDARILAQVDTIIGHKLTIAADVRRFEDNLKSRNPDLVQLGGRSLEFAEWLRTLGQGQAIVSNTEEERTFAIDVRPRICIHGGQGA
jgi:DNA helicase HerA-like ATPase